MTELEPVAWRWSFDDGYIWHCGTEEPGKFRFGDPDKLEPLVTLSSAQSVIAERDARIAELENLAMVLEAEANQMREVSIMNRHRAEAAEALLKVHGELVEQAEHVCMGAHTPMDIRDAAKNLKEPLEKIYAARSLMSKIGERNGE